MAKEGTDIHGVNCFWGGSLATWVASGSEDSSWRTASFRSCRDLNSADHRALGEDLSPG